MKKLLFSLLTFFISTSVVFGATNLWQFYNEQGLLLPSYEYRKDFYEQILAEDEYKGTAKQNALYLQYLQENDFVESPKAEEIKLGASLPSATAVFETSLASPITSSATSLTLTANSVRGGGSLSGYNCFTIDEGATTAETVCGTVSSTAVSSLTRGISQANGTTTVSALQFAHRRGSNVKITDFPIIQILKAQNNGEDTFANLLTYANTVLIGAGSASTTIATKYYVDNTVSAGASDASETVKGLTELATQIEMASSTSAGSTAALLALRSFYATSTPSGTSYNGLYVPVSKNNGKLHQLWLDLTEVFAWTGLHNFTGNTYVKNLNASSTVVLNGVSLSFPSTQGASSTVLMNNGSGSMTWNSSDWEQIGETILTSANSTTTVSGLPARKDLKVIIQTNLAGIGGGDANMRFNSDSGTNYGSRHYRDYTNVVTNGNSNTMIQWTFATTTAVYIVMDIENETTLRKLITWHGSSDNTTNAPTMLTGTATWNNTTVQINRIDLFMSPDGGGSNQYSAGTRMTVYGKRN